MRDKQFIREDLRGRCIIVLDMSYDFSGMLAQVNSFVALSQGNNTIGYVKLFPFYDVHHYELWVWDKVGQGVGNLKSLQRLTIGVDGPDWEILARILPHIQNKIELHIVSMRTEGTEDKMRTFARAIQGYPTIESVTADFSFESAASLCSALSTLPNLESVLLTQQRLNMGRGEVPTFRAPESITEFLRAPSLRIVEFRRSCFTSSLCQATAMALRQGSSITSLVLSQCSFAEGGSEQIASALKENTTLTTFNISSPAPYTGSIHQAFYDAMAVSLVSNSTLQDLEIRYTGASDIASDFVSTLLLALGMNKTLRKLHVSVFGSVGRSLIAALREGLGKNSTLEILELHVGHDVEPSFLIAVVEALQLNKTLKTLNALHFRFRFSPELTDDEVKHLTSVVKKNYGLERLPDLDLDPYPYLLDDGHGSFVSKGVGVLIAVSDDVNCVFLHLLENPSLCNRRH
jgi:hypothetical protein